MRAKTLITVNCPKCGVDTTVIKNGKGKYLCKNCKVYFREKKNLYPTEIKKLAVAMHGLGISYRVICVLLELGNHRNTVCYWIDKHKADKEILTRELTKELETYKGTCKIINELQEQLKILGENISIAKAYWEKKKERMELDDKLDKISINNTNYTIYSFDIDKLHKEILRMKKPIGLMTVEQIEAEITEKTDELENQKQRKNNMKNMGIFANEKYDLDAIIAVLEKLAGQKKPPVRAA